MDKYSDKCPINAFLQPFQCDSHPKDRIEIGDFEKFGAFSRCLPMVRQGEPIAGCFETKCDISMTKIIVQYRQDNFNSKVECLKEGQKINIDGAYGYEIICPDPRLFCQKAGVLDCQNDCSGSGVCKTDKTCFCDILFESNDCSQTVPCEDDLCKKLIQAQMSAGLFGVVAVLLSMALLGFRS